jgi:hypothetical protein
VPNATYLAFQDGATGAGEDSFALGIAHREGDIVILDLVRERRPRFVAYAVIAEWAQILRSYGIYEIHGDRFAFGLFAAEWGKHHIVAREPEHTTSEIYLRGLPLVLGRRVRLLDNPRLREQLLSLERRLVDGHEQVDHPKTPSAHDDVACAAMGAIVTAATRSRYRLDVFDPNFRDEDLPPPPAEQQPSPMSYFGTADWWRSMPRSAPTYSANDRLRGLYQSLDVASKSGFF